MLEYLVTSSARRRLLGLLWADEAAGTASELAARAELPFASAHTELKAMLRAGVAVSTVDSGRERYAANLEHPGANALRTLVALDASPPGRVESPRDDETRRALVGFGAPLRGVKARTVDPDEHAAVLVDAVRLARRDPTVARVLPISLWSLRAWLDVGRLAAHAARAEDKHALGFMLALAGELGGDRRLGGLAEQLRDRRMTSTRDFFYTGRFRRRLYRDFPLAAAWGFRLNTDLEAFKTLFDKCVPA